MNVNIHYIKNSDFRTSYASGVFGGTTLSGLINMNFYVDRAVIPQASKLDVDETNGITIETPINMKDGVVREMKCGILLDVNTAKAAIAWLQEKIDFLEQNTITK